MSRVQRPKSEGDNSVVPPRELVARASLVIHAPRASAWQRLLAPETITRILPVTEVVLPWRGGEPFKWSFTLEGRASTVEGRVHQLLEERLLVYEYLDPHSRDVHGANDNVHRVTIELRDAGPYGDATQIEVTQDGNLTEMAKAHAAGGWRLALNNLKWLSKNARSPLARREALGPRWVVPRLPKPSSGVASLSAPGPDCRGLKKKRNPTQLRIGAGESSCVGNCCRRTQPREDPMPESTEDALYAIRRALSAQDQQFAAFVEAFSELSPDTRLDVSPAVLEAIEATTVVPHVRTPTPTLNALRG